MERKGTHLKLPLPSHLGKAFCRLKPISQLRFDYDTTTTRLQRKIDTFIFLLASNRVEWKQAHAIRRSRIVVVSQSNQTHIVISITCIVYSRMRRGIVVSYSCRRLVVVQSQLWYRLTIRLRSDYDVSRATTSIRPDSTPAKNERVNFSS